MANAVSGRRGEYIKTTRPSAITSRNKHGYTLQHGELVQRTNICIKAFACRLLILTITDAHDRWWRRPPSEQVLHGNEPAKIRVGVRAGRYDDFSTGRRSSGPFSIGDGFAIIWVHSRIGTRTATIRERARL